MDNKIDGTVLAFFEIDTLKRTLAAAEEARANEAIYQLFKATKERANEDRYSR